MGCHRPSVISHAAGAASGRMLARFARALRVALMFFAINV
jgi:hypothetical protein